MNAKFELAIIPVRELTINSESEWPRFQTRTYSIQVFVGRKRVYLIDNSEMAFSLGPQHPIVMGSFGPKHIQSP